MKRIQAWALVLAVGALGLSACGTAAGPQDAPKAAPVAALRAATAAVKPCDDGAPPTDSIAPGSIGVAPSTWPSDSTMTRIRKRGYLIVGTSGDVRLWGSRNPENGKLEGYDTDVLREVARALDVDPARTVYKVINYAQRLPALVPDRQTSVDVVAHTMTINCDRWQGTGGAVIGGVRYPINFSIPYYQAGQKVLVRKDSRATSIQQLKNDKVCVAKGSTNLDNIAGIIPADNQVQVDDLGACLVDFQEGEATAITGDDTVLAGFASQDPYAKVVGETFSSEPYGLGIPAEDTDFTRFANALVERMRSDGTLKQLYQKWMAPNVVGGAYPALPKAEYGRQVSRLGRS